LGRGTSNGVNLRDWRMRRPDRSESLSGGAANAVTEEEALLSHAGRVWFRACPARRPSHGLSSHATWSECGAVARLVLAMPQLWFLPWLVTSPWHTPWRTSRSPKPTLPRIPSNLRLNPPAPWSCVNN